MEPVVLETIDHVLIAGSYSRGSGSAGALLLHMMPATKESWRPLVPPLIDRGLHVLAIDLRGHGESSGGPEGYRDFSPEEHQAGVHDVAAGVDFLLQRGCERSRIALIGASIGANLAVCFLALHHDTHRAVLLSPGLNYHGVDARKAIRDCVSPQRFLFVTSADDVQSGNNSIMVQELIETVRKGVAHSLIAYKNAGHGTNMFGKEEPDLAREIVSWLG